MSSLTSEERAALCKKTDRKIRWAAGFTLLVFVVTVVYICRSCYMTWWG